MSKEAEDKMIDAAIGAAGPGTIKSLHQAFMENQDKAKAAPRGQFSATIRVVGGWTGTPVAIIPEANEAPKGSFAFAIKGLSGGTVRYVMSRDEMIALAHEMMAVTKA